MSTAGTLEFTEEETPDKLRESPQIPKGRYHLAIIGMEALINEQSQIEFGFKLDLQVLAGSIAGQEKKRFSESFNYPSDSHKDHGKFCGQRLKALLLATGSVPPGTTGAVTPNYGELPDRQFIADLDTIPWSNGKGASTGISGLKMYHVDEPEVANVPKHPGAIANFFGHRWTLEMIQAAQAKLAEKAKPAASTAATSTAGSADTPKPAAKAATRDWSNL